MILNGLNQQTAAALLSVTARTLRDWVDVPRNPDGTYNAPALVAYYVAKMSGDAEYDTQRERLAAAQADKYEMDNAVRRGQLADVPATERAWAECVVNARSRLLGMGSKLGPQLVNIGDPSIIAAAIRAEARAALGELASYDPGRVADAAGSDPAGEPSMGAPARVNGERVGGSGKASKQRKQRRAGPVED